VGIGGPGAPDGWGGNGGNGIPRPRGATVKANKSRGGWEMEEMDWLTWHEAGRRTISRATGNGEGKWGYSCYVDGGVSKVLKYERWWGARSGRNGSSHDRSPAPQVHPGKNQGSIPGKPKGGGGNGGPPMGAPTPPWGASMGLAPACPSAAYEEVMESITDWAFSWPISKPGKIFSDSIHIIGNMIEDENRKDNGSPGALW
jgi:hypothetical protein